MYRTTKESRYPFSRPSGTARTATVSLVAAALAAGIIVACEHGHVSQRTANGTVATGSEPDPAGTTLTPAAATAPVAPTAPVVPPDVSYATAESAFTDHRYPVATEMFTAYTARRPNNAWGYYMLGLSAWRAGQLDRAEDALKGAMTRDPHNVRAVVNLARVLLDQNRATDALDQANAAVAMDSGLGEAWRVLGRVQGQLGHGDSAIDAYQAALKIDSSDVWALNDLGLELIDAGRYSDAVQPLTQAVQLDSTVPVFSNNLGIAFERSGQLTAAAAAYRGALAADSGYARAKVSLARVEKALGC